MKKIITKFNIFDEGDNPFFGHSATEIFLDDEASGVFIKLVQFSDDRDNEVRFNLEEIDIICETLQELKIIGKRLLDA